MPERDASADRRPRPGPGAPRLVVLVVGVVYLVLGVLGIFVPGNFGSTGSGPFTSHQPQYTLWIFSVGPLLNVMRILIGALGLLAARSSSGTAIFSFAATIWLAGVSTYSILVLTLGTGDRLNVNWATAILHLATMVVTAVVATLGMRGRPRREKSAARISGTSAERRSGPK
ncbi:DUF4383 domain-containing protein [Amycolatopsis carbonis]|uniref:DUF4383 domain-containing protein n=1 Tax=Amycolatopsis carbonis TaxID=715471 RepID=A0A9Y2I9M7_9PSEU|nr:DUF4383 domain-containing protein [Amycolatopsis sp. 2-15]WIX75559.1 DUF4383 domain-containing protein [Amycolatopsis sp. 2-15]